MNVTRQNEPRKCRDPLELRFLIPGGDSGAAFVEVDALAEKLQIDPPSSGRMTFKRLLLLPVAEYTLGWFIDECMA